MRNAWTGEERGLKTIIHHAQGPVCPIYRTLYTYVKTSLALFRDCHICAFERSQLWQLKLTANQLKMFINMCTLSSSYWGMPLSDFTYELNWALPSGQPQTMESFMWIEALCHKYTRHNLNGSNLKQSLYFQTLCGHWQIFFELTFQFPFK